MRFGISGHQSLEKRLAEQGASQSEAAAWEWVERRFTDTLSEVEGRGNVVVSSLASGADQRLSRIAVDLGCALEVVTPSEGYLDTFGNRSDRDEYERLVAQATEVVTLNHPEPSEEAFLSAGKRVVDRVDTLVAVWDGQDAEGLGGTGDIVAYARKQGQEVIHLDPIRLVVNRSS